MMYGIPADLRVDSVITSVYPGTEEMIEMAYDPGEARNASGEWVGRRVRFMAADSGSTRKTVRHGKVVRHTPSYNTSRSRGGRYDRLVIEEEGTGRNYTRDASTVRVVD